MLHAACLARPGWAVGQAATHRGEQDASHAQHGPAAVDQLSLHHPAAGAGPGAGPPALSLSTDCCCQLSAKGDAGSAASPAEGLGLLGQVQGIKAIVTGQAAGQATNVSPYSAQRAQLLLSYACLPSRWAGAGLPGNHRGRSAPARTRTLRAAWSNKSGFRTREWHHDDATLTQSAPGRAEGRSRGR
jgi:hypothetical protein